MDMLVGALSAGKLCVVDVSQLRGESALVLSGLILRRIFQRNQEEFTQAQPRTIPTIAVIEEAQSVLNERSSASGPYIEWVKEGRKYDLGAVLITQQPGSIPVEILSQGDNWFIFHLLSAADLGSVRHANAHFSDDILSALLNEPIPGQGVFWSSVSGRPYPVSVRVLSFEQQHKPLDPGYDRAAIKTYASELRGKFEGQMQSVLAGAERAQAQPATGEVVQGAAENRAESEAGEPADPLRTYQAKAVEALKGNADFRRSLDAGGIAWGVVKHMLKDHLPESMADRDEVAYSLVAEAVSTCLGGKQGEAWDTERRPAKTTGRMTTFIVRKAKA
jgi:hypothetical protein